MEAAAELALLITWSVKSSDVELLLSVGSMYASQKNLHSQAEDLSLDVLLIFFWLPLLFEGLLACRPQAEVASKKEAVGAAAGVYFKSLPLWRSGVIDPVDLIRGMKTWEFWQDREV